MAMGRLCLMIPPSRGPSLRHSTASAFSSTLLLSRPLNRPYAHVSKSAHQDRGPHMS